jgi:hypothetical protein
MLIWLAKRKSRKSVIRVYQCKEAGFHESHFFTFNEIEIPTKFYLIFDVSEILISMSKSDFWFRFLFQLFTCNKIESQTKFHSLFVKISMSKSEFRIWFWCQNWNFHFGFNFNIGMLILISISDFDTRFQCQN